MSKAHDFCFAGAGFWESSGFAVWDGVASLLADASAATDKRGKAHRSPAISKQMILMTKLPMEEKCFPETKPRMAQSLARPAGRVNLSQVFFMNCGKVRGDSHAERLYIRRKIR